MGTRGRLEREARNLVIAAASRGGGVDVTNAIALGLTPAWVGQMLERHAVAGDLRLPARPLREGSVPSPSGPEALGPCGSLP